ncbi:MAG: flagellar basal body P-ring formation chaperone FlgA [Pseudomonadota bacterium]
MTLALALNGVAWSRGSNAQPIVVMSSADLQLQVREWLQRDIETSGRPAKLEDLGSWGLQADLNGPVWVSQRGWLVDAHTRQVEVLVQSSEQEDAQHVGSLRFVLRDLAPVWVAVAPMRAGALVSCDALRQDMQVVRSSVPHRWIGSCDAIKGWHVKRPLDAGSVLLSADLAPPSAVLANSEANASIAVGAVRIDVKATVLADGQVGQVIPIRLAGQSTVLKAKVLGAGEVIVTKGL